LGFNLAWVTVHGSSKGDILDVLRMTDTGKPDQYFESDLAGGQLSGGWYVILDRTFGIYDEKWWRPLSRRARVIAAAMSEGAMVSAAREWADEREIWFVEHDGNDGGDKLETFGVFPREFTAIRDKQIALQRGAKGVDHIFDIPIELAYQIAGFRPDKMPVLFGPKFTELRLI